MAYQHIKIPATGEAITVNSDYSLNVPNNPIIPFIEGDGIGVDVTPPMLKVVDAAVAKAYKGTKKYLGLKFMLGKKLIIYMVVTLGCLMKL